MAKGRTTTTAAALSCHSLHRRRHPCCGGGHGGRQACALQSAGVLRMMMSCTHADNTVTTQGRGQQLLTGIARLKFDTDMRLNANPLRSIPRACHIWYFHCHGGLGSDHMHSAARTVWPGSTFGGRKFEMPYQRCAPPHDRRSQVVLVQFCEQSQRKCIQAHSNTEAPALPLVPFITVHIAADRVGQRRRARRRTGAVAHSRSRPPPGLL